MGVSAHSFSVQGDRMNPAIMEKVRNDVMGHDVMKEKIR
jgi:hypothetical protein